MYQIQTMTNSHKLVLLTCLLSLNFFTGCARFSTKQVDLRTDAQSGETTKITTKASAFTFFDAKSKLANFKANQTDKTQGASVGALEQDATSANALEALKAIESIAKSIK